MQRLLGRTALAIDGGSWYRLGPTGRENRIASDVEGLLADLGYAAHDDVINEGGVEIVALGECAKRLGREIDRVPVLEFSVALTSGGAQRIDDDGFWHHAPSAWANPLRES